MLSFTAFDEVMIEQKIHERSKRRNRLRHPELTAMIDFGGWNRAQGVVGVYNLAQINLGLGTIPITGTGRHYPSLDMGITTTCVPIWESRDTPVCICRVTNTITRARCEDTGVGIQAGGVCHQLSSSLHHLFSVLLLVGHM